MASQARVLGWCLLVAACASSLTLACKKERVADGRPAASSVTVEVTPVPVAPPVATFGQSDQEASTPVAAASVDAAADARVSPKTLEKARAAALAGNYPEVRALLYRAARTGHEPEAGRMVREACKQLHDQACLDEMRAKYP